MVRQALVILSGCAVVEVSEGSVRSVLISPCAFGWAGLGGRWCGCRSSKERPPKWVRARPCLSSRLSCTTACWWGGQALRRSGTVTDRACPATRQRWRTPSAHDRRSGSPLKVRVVDSAAGASSLRIATRVPSGRYAPRPAVAAPVPLTRQEQPPLQRAGGDVGRGVDADSDLAVGAPAQGPAALRGHSDRHPSLVGHRHVVDHPGHRGDERRHAYAEPTLHRNGIPGGTG